MSSEGKRRRHMNIPHPPVIRDFHSDLDQTLHELLYWSCHLLPAGIELPEHVQEVVGLDSYKQLGLVGGESLATRLVAAKQRTSNGSKR